MEVAIGPPSQPEKHKCCGSNSAFLAALRGAVNTLRKFRPRMAIASEHLTDDVVAIPKTVRAIAPGYEVICGQCEMRDGGLAAQVLWFK